MTIMAIAPMILPEGSAKQKVSLLTTTHKTMPLLFFHGGACHERFKMVEDRVNNSYNYIDHWSVGGLLL